jgi:HNH endonuclease
VGFALDLPLRREYSFNYTYTPHVCHVIILLSFSSPGSQSTNFATRIRDRDRRCCITGREVFGNNFTGFETAHIFPLGQSDEVGRIPRSVYAPHIKSQWNRKDMQRFITDPSVPANDKMNSIQQGFLCLSTEHKLFDDYQIGVNPDVCFAY